ncbi:MAG: FGGY family carbohydrate kinase [Candidatus Humimicrobiaceae bacterium]
MDENGNIISSDLKEYPLYTPKPGWAEQNPKDWYDATITTITGAMQKAGITGADVKAIGLSGQMHGSVFLDKNEQVIRPALLWCDQRTEPQCREIYDIFGGFENFIKLSFNKLFPALHLRKFYGLGKMNLIIIKRLQKYCCQKTM